MTQEARNTLRQISGRIHHTESFGAVDGPGIRFVLFLAGCPLRCLYCHNPDAIPFGSGTAFTAGQIADEALRYIHFIKKGGVTFSGGEPLLQPEFVKATALLLKEKGLHLALDTSGGINPALPAVRAAIDSVDLLLLDIKAADDETAVALTGHSMANAFATLDYCEAVNKPVWIRHVLVAGYTLNPIGTEKLARLLAPYRCIERVELLPFHKLGEPKWEEMKMEYQLADTPATRKEEVQAAKTIFTAQGLPVV